MFRKDSKSCTRSEKFCFMPFYIRVEDTMYQIDKRALTYNSEYFRTKYEPKDVHQEVAVEQDSNFEDPLVFEDLSVAQMDVILAHLCPNLHDIFHDPDDSGLIYKGQNLDERYIVLKFAHQWQFEALRARHLYYLKCEIKDPVEKLALYRDYNIPADFRIIPAIEALVQRKEDLRVEEAEKIATDTLMKLCNLRTLYASFPELKDSKKLRNKIQELWGQLGRAV